MLVAKLKGARERKKAVTGKCGGRKSYAERRPELVAIAKRLARYPINGSKRSLRDIAGELEAQGHVTGDGTRYAATAVARMIAARDSRTPMFGECKWRVVVGSIRAHNARSLERSPRPGEVAIVARSLPASSMIDEVIRIPAKQECRSWRTGGSKR